MKKMYHFSLLCLLFSLSTYQIESVGFLSIFRRELLPKLTPKSDEFVEPVGNYEISNIADSIKHKLNPNYVDRYGYNGLHMMFLKQSENLELLLKSHPGLNFNQQSTEEKLTPAAIACLIGIQRFNRLIKTEQQQPSNPQLYQPLQSFFNQYPDIEIDSWEGVVFSSNRTNNEKLNIQKELIAISGEYFRKVIIESKGNPKNPLIKQWVQSCTISDMLNNAMEKQQQSVSSSSSNASTERAMNQTDTGNSQAIDTLNNQIAWNETCLRETIQERMYILRLLLLEERAKTINETTATQQIRAICNAYPSLTLCDPNHLVASPILDEAIRQSVENELMEIGISLANERTGEDHRDVFIQAPIILQQRISQLKAELENASSTNC